MAKPWSREPMRNQLSFPSIYSNPWFGVLRQTQRRQPSRLPPLGAPNGSRVGTATERLRHERGMKGDEGVWMRLSTRVILISKSVSYQKNTVLIYAQHGVFPTQGKLFYQIQSLHLPFDDDELLLQDNDKGWFTVFSQCGKWMRVPIQYSITGWSLISVQK